MQIGQPSRTALAAALHRAAHQVLEQGRIFSDPLALRILGVDAQTVVRKAGENPSGRPMRLFIAIRTRFAEDALAASFENGVRQVVVLGAGLDTFAYRSPLRDRLRIFEVDHPATQAWKRQRLRDAAILLPSSLTFAPVDFERETLAECLAMAGFDRTQQAFFTWLGSRHLPEPRSRMGHSGLHRQPAQWRKCGIRLQRSSVIVVAGEAGQPREAGGARR